MVWQNMAITSPTKQKQNERRWPECSGQRRSFSRGMVMAPSIRHTLGQ